MTNHSSEAEQGELQTLFELPQIAHVAIIDDVFDEAEQMQLSADDRLELWGKLEFSQGVRDEITELCWVLHQADDLTDERVNNLLEDISQCPLFYDVWQRTLVGQHHIAGLSQVRILTNYLRQFFELDVLTFPSDAEPWEILENEPQLVFLDWQLGVGTHEQAVQAAANKARRILEKCEEDNKSKPLFVLISSIPGMEESADDFCRTSGILRGMFYTARKTVLTDLFNLRMYMEMFAVSLLPGRRVQKFIDSLQGGFVDAGKRFIEGIRDLTLNDYAYIQRMSLQREGQPLGDYLFSLFSSYLSHLVFSEALGRVRGDLDTMTFGEFLPSLDPPSKRLTEVYHSSLFDTNVGEIGLHTVNSAEGESVRPVLALGDTLKRELASGCETAQAEDWHNTNDQTEADRDPDLFLVITPECDLQLRPSKNNDSISIILLPGFLHFLREDISNDYKAKTELFLQDGKSYQIGWDVKRVQSVPFKNFASWTNLKQLKRVARLRQPYALEVQHSFSADLSRIGTPVMPPIYQPISVSLLRTNLSDGVYETIDSAGEEEAAFLVSSRGGQQCVFTLPLITKLRQLLDDNNIPMTEPALKDLRNPFKLPTTNSPKNLSNGQFKILLGATEGDVCPNSRALVVGLHVDHTITI